MLPGKRLRRSSCKRNDQIKTTTTSLPAVAVAVAAAVAAVAVSFETPSAAPFVSKAHSTENKETNSARRRLLTASGMNKHKKN